jgi:hypothetical protein
MTKAFFETIHLDNEMFKGIEKAMADKNSPERKKWDKEMDERFNQYLEAIKDVPKPKI